LPKLKLLITSGMRNAAIDMEAAKDHSVVLCGTQFARDPTAPLTMGLILELTRNIGRENARMPEGQPWQTFVGHEIEGRTLGVIGLGKLGSKVAGLAKAFGMNVIAWSPNLTPERCKEVGVTYATKEELFKTADVITIHVVLGQRSRGLVGRDDLARMKPTSYLVNTARGPIVDEGALLQTLQQNKIAGAAVDVFSVEPLPVDHPFRKLDNMVVTPHLGYVTDETFRGHDGRLRAGRASRDLRGSRRCRAICRLRRRRSGGGRWWRRAARTYDHPGADLDPIEQVRDVFVQHADASRGDELANGRGLIGAV